MNVIRNKYEDDVPVNTGELAEAMRISRFTVGRWKQAGHRFLYGNLTTPGHCKAWLAARAAAESNEFEDVLNGLN